MFSTIAFRVFPIIYFPLSFIKQIGHVQNVGSTGGLSQPHLVPRSSGSSGAFLGTRSARQLNLNISW
jgi:hypothetical protein